MILQYSSHALILASVGAVHIVPTTNREIVESLNVVKNPSNEASPGYNNMPEIEGKECSFVDSFRVREEHVADVGILGCAEYEHCAEDRTSSLGGRCISLEKYKSQKLLGSQRRLEAIPCMYTDGTTGVKCDGENACSNINPDNVGCGSCNGQGACYSYALGGRAINVGERSCLGKYACYSGFNLSPITIGDNSCVQERSCAYAYADIGDNACVGAQACNSIYNNVGPIGDCQCVGPRVCESPLPGEFIKSADICPTDQPSTSPTLSPSALSPSPSSCPTSCTAALPCFPPATKVKIQSLTGVFIQMFEVQVISSGLNVALGKDASQSSDHRDQSKFAASRAIDGDTTTFSHTGADDGTGVWWEVDLGGPFPIESIKITNRWCGDSNDANGCLCRLSNAAVSLLDEQGKWSGESFLTGNTCGMLEVVHKFSASSGYCSQ